MIRLTQKQTDAILREVKAGSTIKDGSKNAGVSASCYQRWSKKFGKAEKADTFESEPEPKKYAKKSTRSLLVGLVKTQLDENPEFAARCVKLLDLEEMLKGT